VLVTLTAWEWFDCGEDGNSAGCPVIDCGPAAPTRGGPALDLSRSEFIAPLGGTYIP
jgi:hypothetical protein